MTNRIGSFLNKVRGNMGASYVSPMEDQVSSDVMQPSNYFVDAIVDGVYLSLLSDVTEQDARTLFSKLEAFRFTVDRNVAFVGVTTPDGGETIIVREALGAFSYGRRD